MRIRQYKKADCTPEEWERYKKYRRDLYARKGESARAYERARSAKRRERDKDGINKKQRDHYNKDPNGAAKQRRRRHVREPHRIIRSARTDFERGRIDFGEYLRRVDEAVTLSEQKTIGAGINETSRPRGDSDGKTEHGNNCPNDSDQNKSN